MSKEDAEVGRFAAESYDGCEAAESHAASAASEVYCLPAVVSRAGGPTAVAVP